MGSMSLEDCEGLNVRRESHWAMLRIASTILVEPWLQQGRTVSESSQALPRFGPGILHISQALDVLDQLLSIINDMMMPDDFWPKVVAFSCWFDQSTTPHVPRLNFASESS